MVFLCSAGMDGDEPQRGGDGVFDDEEDDEEDDYDDDPDEDEEMWG